jgi:hypothetical protein
MDICDQGAMIAPINTIISNYIILLKEIDKRNWRNNTYIADGLSFIKVEYGLYYWE